jgi:hypothetical protein
VPDYMLSGCYLTSVGILRLEIVCRLIPHPGFESLSLRHTMQKPA